MRIPKKGVIMKLFFSAFISKLLAVVIADFRQEGLEMKNESKDSMKNQSKTSMKKQPKASVKVRNEQPTINLSGFMKEAIKEAQKAYARDEAPIGAVIVHEGRIIARGHNERETKADATLHAEMTAIRRACKKIDSWRLQECDLYVTLEPCAMCAGAIIQSRIRRVYYGADDPKAGAGGSVVNILQESRFNHQVEVYGGILEEECAGMLKEFFHRIRDKNRDQSKKHNTGSHTEKSVE